VFIFAVVIAFVWPQHLSLILKEVVDMELISRFLWIGSDAWVLSEVSTFTHLIKK